MRKITANMVKCAKCANCINNKFRLEIGTPGAFETGCTWCFTDRLRKKSDLVLAQVDALRSMVDALHERYYRTFSHPDSKEFDYTGETIHRYEVLKELPRMAAEILGARDEATAKELKGRYDAEWSGSSGKEAVK